MKLRNWWETRGQPQQAQPFRFLRHRCGRDFRLHPIHDSRYSQPIKLGLAGGPLIIAILLGYFGPRWRITTYTTQSANLMIREIGISFFMAAVGLGAGENFVSSILNGGYWWILYGALITLVPVLIVGMIARWACRLNSINLRSYLGRDHQRCGAGLLPGGLRTDYRPSTM